MPLAYDVIVKRMMQNGRKAMRGECKQNVKLHKYTKIVGKKMKKIIYEYSQNIC